MFSVLSRPGWQYSKTSKLYCGCTPSVGLPKAGIIFRIADSLKQKQVSMGMFQDSFEVLDQYMLHIVESIKFFIDVHVGNLILDTSTLSVACDYNKREDKALEVARDLASKTGASLGGIKHIMNSGFHQHKESLDIENQEVTHIAAQWQH